MQNTQSSGNSVDHSPAIVCVEDDDTTLELEVQLIRIAFPAAEIHGFRSGDEALTYCLADPPDVLVTNVTMPGMTGIELIRELRKHGLAIPTLVTSGNYTEDRFARDGIQLGDKVKFIKKPFTAEHLISEIRVFLQ